MHIAELIDKNGRVPYDVLLSELKTTSVTDFLDEAQDPFLVGQELYDGFFVNELYETDHHIGDTKSFQVTAIRREYDRRHGTGLDKAAADSVTHAIFALRKQAFSREQAGVISIGRHESNDIVIADYSISKNHARIIEFRGMFFLIDLESTNGTMLNHLKVTPNIKLRLEADAIITFGRLSFVFMSPYDLYQGLLKEALVSSVN